MNMDALPRRDRSNTSINSHDSNSPPRVRYVTMPPDGGQHPENYHYNTENQAATGVAQNMQHQAMDFINVLKSLITDTMSQQN